MALTGHITVTPEELANQADVVKRELDQMRRHFENLQSQMNGTRAYWTGEAADAHREHYWQKQSKIEEMLHKYQEHVTDLETMAGVYQEAEMAAVQAAEELPISML